MSIYFRMNNTPKREVIHFDGMQISLRELKIAIVKAKNFSGDDVLQNLRVTSSGGKGPWFSWYIFDSLRCACKISHHVCSDQYARWRVDLLVCWSYHRVHQRRRTHLQEFHAHCVASAGQGKEPPVATENAREKRRRETRGHNVHTSVSGLQCLTPGSALLSHMSAQID